MPTVVLSKSVLEEYLGKTLPLDELKDRISMLGTDLESIEGDQITVEIFPNRPDMLSQQGFARALSSFLNIKTGLQKIEVKSSGRKVIIDKSVTMRPYTACAIVKNLQFDEERIREIMQMQEKLATTHGRSRKKSAYGVYPLNSIQFPIRYIAKDPSKVKFKPLGFTTEIRASDVEKLHPKGKEYKHVCEGWKEYPFFIDNTGSVMCMLPYTNSEDTGKVDESTTEIFIECSGVDLKNVTLALNMFVSMFSDMGGEIYSLDIVYPDKMIITPNFSPKKMKLDLAYVNKRLGLKLSKKEAISFLARMGFGEAKDTILIPPYRADILHQVDLVEDIAIAYGYENFVEEIPNVATVGQEDQFEKNIAKVKEILIGFGLLEAKTYHLMTKEDLMEKMNSQNSAISLKNSIGEQNHLRNSLLPSLLKVIHHNQHHEYPQNMFEIGRVFIEGKTETGVAEPRYCTVILAHDKSDFTEIKQILDSLANLLNKEIVVKEGNNSSFITGRVADIFIEKNKIGRIGEIHPQVLTSWDIIVPVVGFEIELEKLFEEKKE